MTNVQYNVEGNTLVIKIDLTKEVGPSKSGKAILVASSHGFFNIESTAVEGLALNLNVVKK